MIGENSENTAAGEAAATDSTADAAATDATSDAKQRLMEAALANVAFDGWTDATFKAAIADSGVSPQLARALFPRGGVDLAVAYHQKGDALMVERLKAADLDGLRLREKIARAIRIRLDLVEDKEAVRRGTTLFTLPHYSAEGLRALWGTADAIWTTLGDTAEDLNWYSKRTSLSAIYSATVLFWLGDDSPDHKATWDFLDRRIDNLMMIEKGKANLRANPLGKALMAGPDFLASKIRKPKLRDDLPGHIGPKG